MFDSLEVKVLYLIPPCGMKGLRSPSKRDRREAGSEGSVESRKAGCELMHKNRIRGPAGRDQPKAKYSREWGRRER